MTSSYAKFIGRVGALAVALGIGGSIATSPGLALADESSPSSSSDSTESSTQGESTGSFDDAPGTDDNTPAGGGTEITTGAPDFDSATGSDESPSEGDSSAGSLDDAPATEDDAPADPGTEDTEGTPESEASNDSQGAEHRAPYQDSDTSAGQAAENAWDTGQATSEVTDGPAAFNDVSDTGAQADTSDDATAFDLQGLTTQTLATAFATETEQPVVQQTRMMALPSAIISAASDLIGAALAAIVGPEAPSDSPLLWGLLGWVRRQFGTALADDTPPANVVQTTLVAADAQEISAVADEHSGLPEDLERTVLASGLNEPTDLRFLPDGGILIVEKSGAVKVFKNGQLQTQPLITIPTQTGGEKGLTAIAVDPDFTINHFVYVAYTGLDDHERLSRLTVTGYTGDPTTESLSIDPSSEHLLLASDQTAANFHQGGGLEFGPDKMLYWSLGDNFFAPNSQDLSTLQGKILRLDPYHLNPDGTATAPADNPFVNTPVANPLVYAYGFRNPFRFTFAPDGTLLEADVGGSAWEEVNVVTPGANYGWPLAEGFCEDCGFANPIYAYPHTPLPAKAGSITAVMVYTGDTLGDAYKNKVFIADYSLGFIRELTFDSEYTSFISERTIDDEAGTTILLAQGPDGNIYQLNYAPGELLVIAPSGGNRAPSAVLSATPIFGKPAPLTVNFSSQGSSDPEGAPLGYSWDFGDNTAVSTDPNPVHTYTTNGIYVATLTVSDGEKSSQMSQQIFVGNTAPSVQITTPVDESKYSAGTTISFSGTATDAEDTGTLPDSAFKWTVIFHHAEHVHPFANNILGRSGSVEIPTDPSQLSNTWYEISLTVTDSQGLSSTQSVEIRPNLVNLTYNANNPDVVYTIDGTPHKGPYSEQGVVGVKHVIGVPSPQFVGGNEVVFSRWSDGGAQQHTITTPTADAGYTVTVATVIPHAEFEPGAILKKLQQNVGATIQLLGTAFKSSAGAVVEAVTGLPSALLGAVRDAVENPTHLPSIVTGLVSGLVGDVVGAVTPVVYAVADVVVTTVKRSVGVASAVIGNVVPITSAVIDAPAQIGAAVKDSATLLFGFLQKVDILGTIGSLQYAQLTIQNEVAHQINNIVGSVADLQHDIVVALSVSLPTAAQSNTVEMRNAE